VASLRRMGPNAVFSIGRNAVLSAAWQSPRPNAMLRPRTLPHLRQDLPGCLRMPCKCALVGLDSGADGGGCNRTASAEA
jgi:hypothetical protein